MIIILMIFFACLLYSVFLLTKRFNHRVNIALFGVSLLIAIFYSLLYFLKQKESMLMLYGIVAQVMVYISYIDIKQRIISLKLLLGIMVLAVIWSIFRKEIAMYNPYITGIIVFSVMSLINRMSNYQIGGGDIKLLSAYALVYGYPSFIPMCFYSLFLSMIFGLVFVIKNKSDLKYELPFAPFLLIGGILYDTLMVFGV